MNKTHSPLANKLLAALPREDFNLLNPHFSIASLPQNVLLFNPDDEVEQIYFPLSGMISLLVVLKNGSAVEIGTVGREGVVGAMAGLGLYRSQVRATVQLPVVVCRIASAAFRKAVAVSKGIAEMCISYNEALLMQARTTAACNLSHPVEARFCRWLLQSRDRIGSDTIPLTQEFLSEMLGVRRTSVTAVAGKMQEEGVISYSRGIIRIVDLALLKARACECYATELEHDPEKWKPVFQAPL